MLLSCASLGRVFVRLGWALRPLSIASLLATGRGEDGSLSQSKALAGRVVRWVYCFGNVLAPAFSPCHGAGGADVSSHSPQPGNDSVMDPFWCLFFLPSAKKEWKEKDGRSIINARMMEKRRE